MTDETHAIFHDILKRISQEQCRLCVRRREVVALLGARIRDMQVENVFIALFACPCCYDGAARVSTGIVLGQPCVVCGGSGRRPKFDPERDERQPAEPTP